MRFFEVELKNKWKVPGMIFITIRRNVLDLRRLFCFVLRLFVVGFQLLIK